MTDLGARIKELRTERGWKQQELAERVGATQSAISQIESGDKQPSFDLIRALCRAFEIPVWSLLGEAPPELRPEEAAHFRALRELPPEAVEELKSYAAFLRHKHGGQSTDG